MATVIDELVVRLGLDGSSFKKGQRAVEGDLNKTRKESDKTARDVEANGKRASEFFGQMQRAAVKFFAVFTLGSGLVNFTRSVVTGGANLARLSRNLGVGTDMLSRWGDAVAKNGGTAEGFQGTLQMLSGALTDIRVKGDSAVLPFFQALGVSIDDGTGKAKELDAILLDVGEGLRKRFSNRADAVNFAKQFGIDEGTLNLLLQGRGEVTRILAEQKGLTKDQAGEAESAEQKWLSLQTRIEEASRKLLFKLLPAIEKLLDLITRFVEFSAPAFTQMGEWIGKMADVTKSWAASLGEALGTLRQIIRLPVPSVGGAFDRFKGWFGGDEPAPARPAAPVAPRTVPRPATPGLAQAPSAGGRQTRGMRNNNPGNLEFMGQRGATPEAGPGRFAKFRSLPEGVAALGRQLQLYGKRGVNTLQNIINKWAPSHENNTRRYIEQMQKLTGFGAKQQLDLQDASTLGLLIRGITTVENGKNFVGREDLLSGLQQLRTQPAAGTQPISIGQITIVTQSTEAQGIARDIRQALVRQADSGMR